MGCICVVWRHNTRVILFFESGQMVKCSVQKEDSETELVFSFVYVLNLMEDRKELWRDLKDHQNSPIVRFLGDFNETVEMEEYSNYDISRRITPGIYDFRGLIHYCSLVNLTTHGPLYTYSVIKQRMG